MSIEKFQPTYDIYKERMEHLKSVVPEAFADGKINWDILKEALGNFVEEDEGEVEHYAFTWPGKRQARRLAGKPPQGTLVPAPGEGMNEETTENIFIEGDNLEVLKLLQKSYAGKIKMIYIDPPYNRGADFIYNDNFTTPLDEYLKLTGQIDEKGSPLVSNTKSDGRFHSKWLNMMYPRLKLAHNLLRDEGIIFISIDDNEIFNLRQICDAVFGEENFVALLSVENNPKGRKNSKFISISNDYCLIYAKEKNTCSFSENIPKNINDMTLDENGNYVHNSGKRVLVGENSFNNEVTDIDSEKHYSVYYSKADNEISIKKESSIDEMDEGLISSGFTRYISQRGDKFIENTYTKAKLLDLFNEDALDFKEDKIFEKNFSGFIRLKSMITNKEYDALINNEKQKFKIDVKTTSAQNCLKELFGTKDSIFPAPKNIGLIKLFATLFEEKDFIVLDFFAGSGTTAHAIMELNSEDHGCRKYIVSQLPEPCEEKSEASKAGFKTIAEIGKERIRRVAKKIKEQKSAEEFPEQDLGFKVFKLQKSHFNEWQDYKGSDVNELMDLFAKQEDALVAGWKPEDLIVEIMLQEGFPLHSKISSMDAIKDNKVIQIKSEFCNHVIFICPDNKVVDKTINDLPLTDKDIFICLDKALTDQQKVSLSDKGVIKTI